MGILKKIKDLVKNTEPGSVEGERPPGVPLPYDDSGWRLRRNDLSKFDLSPDAKRYIEEKRAAREEMDRRTMAEFYRSFGVDPEDWE